MSYNKLIFNYNKIFLYLKVNVVMIGNNQIDLPISCEETTNQLKYYFESKNQNLLVIESMGLGIFLTDYSINKLPYFMNLNTTEMKDGIKYFNIPGLHVSNKKNKKSGCKINIINDNWSTYDWDYNKLKNLNMWINYLPHNSEILDVEVNTSPYTIKKLSKLIDPAFVESLGCILNKTNEEI